MSGDFRLYAEDLDNLDCQVPECKAPEPHVTITSSCHLGSPVHATYHNGQLTFVCAVCAELVCKVQVATRRQPAAPPDTSPIVYVVSSTIRSMPVAVITDPALALVCEKTGQYTTDPLMLNHWPTGI